MLDSPESIVRALPLLFVSVQWPGGQAYLLQGNLLSEPLAYLEQDDIINNQNC